MNKAPRRIVQVATTPAYGTPENEHSAPYGGLVVLLDDGSLWERDLGGDHPWYRVVGPPGTEPQQGDPLAGHCIPPAPR